MSAAEDMSSDEVVLFEGQRALEARRRLEAERVARARMPTLGDVLAEALPRPGSYGCNAGCGQVMPLPGICDECARRDAARALEQRVRVWLRSIPARQRDVTWAALPSLEADRGGSRVRGDLRGMRSRLNACDRGAIVGQAGSGKTTVAVAWLREQLEARPGDRVRFITSADLLRPEVGAEGGPHPLALALSADALVLDDLGAELEGASPGSGLLAQRVGPASRVVAERYERGRRTVVTTGFEPGALAALYGDRVARRVFEAAAVVRLGGA